MVNCFVCGKNKEDYEVWWNKLVIGITYDSEFQNKDIVRNMSDKSLICHVCIKTLESEIKEKDES